MATTHPSFLFIYLFYFLKNVAFDDTTPQEESLSHKMREMAKESEHAQDTVRWAENRHQAFRESSPDANQVKSDEHLMALYRQSVENSGVRIVPGQELNMYQKASNFVAENPLKTLIGLAVPSVGLIFYGRTGKEHLQMSMKLLHTRVFGQFATLSRKFSLFPLVKIPERHCQVLPCNPN